MIPFLLAGVLLLQPHLAMHPTQQDQEEATFATRVVDAATGEPIAGAVLQAYAEERYPWQPTWAPVRRAVSDADGRVRMLREGYHESFSWTFISAPGYATWADMALPEETTRLVRGIDVPVEVRDAFDQPAPGTRLELILGCGHTPAVQVVTTDARGRALFRNVETDCGDIWPVKQGLKGLDDYMYLDWDETWRPGDGPMILRAEFGAWATGVLLDHLGRPVAGAPVGAPRVHRGPWTRTDGRGRFILTGMMPGDDLVVHPAKSQPWGELHVEAAPPGFSMTLRLPPPGEEPAKPGSKLRIEVVEHGTGAPLEGIAIQAVRTRDGYTCSASTEEDGVATVEIFDGHYMLLARSISGDHAAGQDEVEVSSGEENSTRITLRRSPTLAVHCEGLPGALPPVPPDLAIHVMLITPRNTLDITERVRRDERIPVPAQGPYCFRTGNCYRERFVPGPPDRNTSEPVVLECPSPHVITVKVRDIDGNPVQGWVGISSYEEREFKPSPDAGPPAPQWCISTQHGDGHFFLLACPVDTERFEQGALELHLPRGAGRELDAGTLVLPRK